jgi:hypothetical protein
VPASVFVDRALCVVVGLHGQAVLIDGAVALAGHVEDLADLLTAQHASGVLLGTLGARTTLVAAFHCTGWRN